MRKQEEDIKILREKVEATLGRKLMTPKDYNFLTDSIFEKLHKSVSPTTLKRIWGYLSGPVMPRVSTLDILAQFVGFKSWEDFCHQQSETVDKPNSTKATQNGDMLSRPPTAGDSTTDGTSSKDNVSTQDSINSKVGASTTNSTDSKRSTIPSDSTEQVVQTTHLQTSFFSSHRIIILFLLLLTIITASWALYSRLNPPSAEVYILAKGQKFKTYHDYLQLFGIMDTAFYWGRTIPHHPNISVWGPEYQHPRWHNYGDPEQMMPTITERWEPEGVDSAVVAMRNYDNYYHELRVNEVRLTFMRNLVDSGYVFLGVYRMDLAASDSSKCVWERVADQCDLNNLNNLEKFRN